MLDFLFWLIVLALFVFGFEYLRRYLSSLVEKYAIKFGNEYLSLIKYDGLRKWIAILIIIVTIIIGYTIILLVGSLLF